MRIFVIFVSCLMVDDHGPPSSITLPVSSYNRTILCTVLTLQSMLKVIRNGDMF